MNGLSGNTASDWWDVWETVARLPEREQIVCRMVAEGYTQREIGGRLGISQQAVNQMLFRLRSVFRL